MLKKYQISLFYLLVAVITFVQPIHNSALATIEAVEFSDPKLLERYHSLIAELRCLVCQNQNLADSDADLAKDLRRKTEEMLKAGRSDKDILAFMQERYGDFVLYRPPFNGMTALLWLGPFMLLVIAVTSLIVMIRRREQAVSEQGQTSDLSKVRNLLEKTSTHN